MIRRLCFVALVAFAAGLTGRVEAQTPALAQAPIPPKPERPPRRPRSLPPNPRLAERTARAGRQQQDPGETGDTVSIAWGQDDV
jgi:hypothetical protein